MKKILLYGINDFIDNGILLPKVGEDRYSYWVNNSYRDIVTTNMSGFFIELGVCYVN